MVTALQPNSYLSREIVPVDVTGYPPLRVGVDFWCAYYHQSIPRCSGCVEQFLQDYRVPGDGWMYPDSYHQRDMFISLRLEQAERSPQTYIVPIRLYEAYTGFYIPW